MAGEGGGRSFCCCCGQGLYFKELTRIVKKSSSSVATVIVTIISIVIVIVSIITIIVTIMVIIGICKYRARRRESNCKNHFDAFGKGERSVR